MDYLAGPPIKYIVTICLPNVIVTNLSRVYSCNPVTEKIRILCISSTFLFFLSYIIYLFSLKIILIFIIIHLVGHTPLATYTVETSLWKHPHLTTMPPARRPMSLLPTFHCYSTRMPWARSPLSLLPALSCHKSSSGREKCNRRKKFCLLFFKKEFKLLSWTGISSNLRWVACSYTYIQSKSEYSNNIWS